MSNSVKKIICGAKVLVRNFTKQYAPFEINIHITDRCNLKCTYCYSNFYKRKTKDISKEAIFKIVDDFLALGVIEVSLIGGEPFLHPDFYEIVKYVKSKGLFCSAVTNGYFVDDMIEAVKMLDMVCISLDGPQEINDITRGRGSYEKVIEAIKTLKRNNVNTSIRATLQKHNVSYLNEIVAIAEKYDIVLNFGLLFPQSSDDGEKKVISDDTPPDEAYRNVLEQIISLKKKKPHRFFNSITNFKNAVNWPASYSKFFLYEHELVNYRNYKPIKCYGGRAFATIDTDGRLYPCTNLIGYYNAPNIFEIEIKKAWKKINKHNCAACFYLSSVEKNLVSSLNFDALFNLLKVKRIK